MKKRITALFCFLCLLLPLFSGLQTVRADVIFEPENSFYVSHADNCLYHNRSYTTPGDTEYYAAGGPPLEHMQGEAVEPRQGRPLRRITESRRAVFSQLALPGQQRPGLGVF